MTMPTAEITSDVRGITNVNAKKDTAGPEKEKISARESHDEVSNTDDIWLRIVMFTATHLY